MITIEHGPKGSINIAGLDLAVILRLPDKQFAYWCGDEPPNYPMPAIRFVPELVHGVSRVHFFLMYADYRRGTWRIVGDSEHIKI